MTRKLVPLFVLLLAMVARADVLTGIVHDDNGQPIAGASVEVQGLGIYSTGLTGAFSITLARGTYNIQIFEDQNGFAPVILAKVVVIGTRNLGIIAMDDGFDVSGTVMGPAGVVVNGDLDVFDVETGLKLDTPNDKTDLLGQFVLALPARTLRIRAEPVVGQILVAQSLVTTISGQTALGTISLPAGQMLTGTVVGTGSNLPLAGVDIDVDDFFSGTRIETPGDNTDTLGNFAVIVPAGTFTVSFGAAPGQALVGRRIDYVPVSAATSMGTIGLDPGVFINGNVIDASGHPVVDADIDVRALAGDATVYTPNDATGPTGGFSVVVKAGTHRVLVQAPAGSGLVSQSTGFQSFPVGTTLPTFALQPGQMLSGTVSAFGGIPQGQVRIIVKDSVTGTRVETPDNVTDAAGHYAVVVPNGTYDLDCRSRKGAIIRDQIVTGVVVGGPTTRNITMSLVPMLVYLDDPAFPGPQVVLPGAPQFFITVAIWNPTGITGGVLMDAEWEDPYGGIVTMLQNSAIVLGSQQFVFQQFLAIPLPAVNPAHRGLPHRFRLVLKDPIDGSVVDSDQFDLFPL